MPKPKHESSVQAVSVIVPANPFVGSARDARHCLAALDVEKVMEWWPGTPHTPHRNPDKVQAIQRSLDWKRVVQIAAYLLQSEITDAPDKLDTYFRDIYESKASEPGRQWPPKVPRVVGFAPSLYRTFSNVLLHVNGAAIESINKRHDTTTHGLARLVFNENSPTLNFSVIDGQHRINGAYFAVQLLKATDPSAHWDIPAEIFLDLDQPGAPPRHQAQIFIDVNFYQKKVDRSLVADLFPTARDETSSLGDKERAQDLGRKLMLDIGPLQGMIQIPGIRYGVKDVVTLATLNSAIEDCLEALRAARLIGLADQAEFIAQCLDAWLDASGRRQRVSTQESLDPDNVAYQGRVIVSCLTLLPACIVALRDEDIKLISQDARSFLTRWFTTIMKHAGLTHDGRFLSRSQFRSKGYLGSGGLARFRDQLWAAAATGRAIGRMRPDAVATRAAAHRASIMKKLGIPSS